MEQTTPPRADEPLPPVDTAGPHPDPGAADPRAAEPGGFFDSLRRSGVVRTQDRWIGGVAGGVARRLGVDPLLVRGVLGVTALLGGAGLVLYGLAWALLPEEADGRIHLQEAVRGRFDVAVLGAIAFVVVGANRGPGWTGWWDRAGFGWVDGLLWLAAVTTVVALVVTGARRRSARRVGTGRGPVSPWAAPPPPGGAPFAPMPAGEAPSAPMPGGRAPFPPPPGWASATPHAGSSAAPHPGYGAVPLVPAASQPTGADPSAASPVRTGPPSPYPPAAAPYPPSATPYPPRPPRPPRPRVPGPGAGMVGTVVGLVLLALAGLLVLDREGRLGQGVALTALGVGVVLVGLGILASGLRGRRGGVLSLLAVLGVLAAVPAVVTPALEDRFGRVDRLGIAAAEVWRPTTRAEAREGFSVGVGEIRVDLTAVPLGGGPVRVPIDAGAGEIVVVVPDDAAVTAEVTLQAGEVRWDVNGTGLAGAELFGQTETYASVEAADRPAELDIRITAGVGDVRVVEEDR